MTAFRTAAIPSLLALLAACGGGGGAGDTPTVAVPFSAFSSVSPNQTLVMDANAISSDLTYSVGTGGITVDSFNAPTSSTATMRLTYRGSNLLSGISINAPNSNLSFSQGIVCAGGTCSTASATSSALIADPFFFTPNWNYQTFGIWSFDPSAGHSIFGALSAGRPTPSGGLPSLAGPVAFQGITAGFYVDANGVPFSTAALMNATVDFGARNILFTTSDTKALNMNTNAETANTSLNLTGTLTFPGSASFSGNVSTVDNRLSGTASGRFYGPAAEELGGTYHLSRGTRERMIGGFGAKR